ncbi:hypothetical protein JCM8202v2_000715 [Rhodotorula sphaerocarpa]
MPGQIVHTVFWKWNGSQPADYNAQLRTAAQAMVGESSSAARCQIPGLTRVEVGPALEMLYAELESEDALKAYAPHPVHEQFKELTKPYSTDIMAFDIEV